MKSCGAEMGCIGSCKIMFEGARILLLAPSNELEQYYKTLVAAGTPYTYEQVCDAFKSVPIDQ